MSSKFDDYDDDDLKSRLAQHNIVIPITNTTRPILLKKLHKLEANSPNNQTSLSVGYKSNDMDSTIKRTVSSNDSFDDGDLKSRLAQHGIVTPITNTTRQVLLKKLHKLEGNPLNNQTGLSVGYKANDVDSMDTTSNDLNEYEIRDKINELGYKKIPLTDSTRPILSNIIKKKK